MILNYAFTFIALVFLGLTGIGFLVFRRELRKQNGRLDGAERLLAGLKDQADSLPELKDEYPKQWPKSVDLEELKELLTVFEIRLLNFRAILSENFFGPFDRRLVGIDDMITKMRMTRDHIAGSISDILVDLVMKDAFSNLDAEKSWKNNA